MTIEKQWTTKFFNNMYLEMFMTRNEEQLIREAQIIKFFLQAKQDADVLDFCCGTGATANSLHSLGFNVSGIEYSDNYVDIAHKEYPRLNIVQGDALAYDFNKKFQHVYNWFSSFGYFNDEQNMLLLNNMKNHLQDSGTILIEIYNSENILNHFQKQIVYDKQYNNTHYIITRNSNLIEQNKWLEQEWSFKNQLTGQIEFEFKTKTKLYLSTDIVNMLEHIGFKDCQSYHRPETSQNLYFHKPSAASKRIIVTGQL